MSPSSWPPLRRSRRRQRQLANGRVVSSTTARSPKRPKVPSTQSPSPETPRYAFLGLTRFRARCSTLLTFRRASSRPPLGPSKLVHRRAGDCPLVDLFPLATCRLLVYDDLCHSLLSRFFAFESSFVRAGVPNFGRSLPLDHHDLLDRLAACRPSPHPYSLGLSYTSAPISYSPSSAQDFRGCRWGGKGRARERRDGRSGLDSRQPGLPALDKDDGWRGVR